MLIIYDKALNDSDKSFSFHGPTILDSVHVRLSTTATVGNRQIVLEVLTAAADVIFAVYAGVVQAASLVRRYTMHVGSGHDAAFMPAAAEGVAHIPIPNNLTIPAGGSLRIRDSAAIAAAADDMEVTLQYRE